MTIDGPFNARPLRQTEELSMTSSRTTAPMFLKAPKIHALICCLSVVALVLLTSTVGAQQDGLQGEAGYLKSQKGIQQKPTLKELEEACAAIVRNETNERLKYQASEFDAYITADGSVANIGTDQEDVSFGQCMNEAGIHSASGNDGGAYVVTICGGGPLPSLTAVGFLSPPG